MKRLGKLHLGSLVLAFAFTLLLGPNQAKADWSMYMSVDLESEFSVFSNGAGNSTITPFQEGVRADYGFGGIPINYNFQSWNGSSWPSDSIWADQNSPNSTGYAFSSIDTFSTTDELPYNMEASIDGVIENGLGMAAGAAYDFTLNLAADTETQIDIFNSYAEITNGPTALGVAFAGIKIYDPTADFNDYGGVNNPFDEEFLFLSGPGSTGFQYLDLFTSFDNFGQVATTQDLRIEVYTVVFSTQTVPEPGSTIVLALGACLLTRRRKSRLY